MDKLTQIRTGLLILPVVLLAACGGSSSSGPADPPSNNGLVDTPKALLELKEPATCAAFNDRVTDAITGLFVNRAMGVPCPDCPVLMTGAAAAEPAVATDSRSFTEFTGTNNQETGVDELDDIETDANGNFYLLDGGALVVANGLPPANLRQIAKLELGGRPQGLVLDADNRRLVIARSDYIGGPGIDYVGGSAIVGRPYPTGPVTELIFVNVADPAAPAIERRLRIEGYRLAVRRIGARVHLVSHAMPFMPAPLMSDPELNSLRQRFSGVAADSAAAVVLKAHIHTRVAVLVAATDPLDYLPNLSVSVGTQPFVDITTPNCGDLATPDVPMPLELTTVTSVDSDGTDVDTLTVLQSSWNVYASEKHVYLTQTSGGWWFSGAQRQQTVIHKIEVGADRPQYRASGVVEGWTSSSFQLSEHDGYLRVATNRWERDPAAERWLQDNHLYVLGDNGAGTLDVVGKVNGFGAGERIFGARFLGPRGFIVTFRRIDPVFTFDLSVPQDPRLVGQVEIPGVSTYLHPLDDAHLLTIGFDGDANRLNGNFQLQIFDVQNLAEPRLLHKLAPKFEGSGFAWTAANYDHLAFNYFPAGGTLTVPVQYYRSDYRDHFSGFMAFSVSAADGFAELGRLDHSDLARREYCTSPSGLTPVICTAGAYLESAWPRRAVSATYGGSTYIYTLSNVGMKVSAAPTFGTPVAVLPLPGSNTYPWAP